MPHAFLSPEWIEAARALHDEYVGQVEPPDERVRMNITVVDAPFTSGQVLGHVDTTQGSVVPGEGHLESPDVAVQIPYELARRLMVEQRPDELMIAFMSGEVEVEGDVTMLMVLQDLDPTPAQQALADEITARLAAITE